MKSFMDRLRKVNPNIRGAVIVTVVYALITIIVTYPVAFKLTSSVAGFDGRDSLQYVWSLWWAHKAIIDLRTSPANLTFLYHPTGAYHPLLFVTPYLELVSLPLEGVLNPITVYNIQFLLSFILTGLTTYLLGLELTGNRYAAFIGGLIFAFFPNRMGHALAGHLPQITTYWFPLYVLFLIRLNKAPSLKNSLLCGIFLTLSLLVNIMHVAYFLVPVTLIFLLYQGWSNRRRFLDTRFLKGLGLALLLAGLLTAPLFVPFMVNKFTGKLGFLSEEGTLKFSNDLLAFISPSRYHLVLSRFELLPSFTAQVLQKPRDLEEKIAYLGMVPLLLAGLGVSRNREARVWAIIGLCAAILSLGPFLKVGGEPVRYTIENEESYVLLPYAFLKKLPFYEWGRTPGRLSETVTFALAVLAAHGVARIAEILNGKLIKPGILLGLSLLVLFEYNVIFPWPVGGENRPSVYEEIAKDTEDYAILDVPIAGSRYVRNYAMFYQTFHEHRIVGGYIHRDPPGTLDVAKDISALVQPGNSDSTKTERLRCLRNLGIGRVVVHKGRIDDEATSLDFHRDLLGEEIFEDSQISVFAVPGAMPKKAKHSLQFDLGDKVRVLGYSLEPETVKPGDPFTITLYWKMLSPIDPDCKLSLHLEKEGQIWGQKDRRPACGILDGKDWIPSQEMADSYTIRVSPHAPDGWYPLSLGMYHIDPKDQHIEHLPIFDQEGKRLSSDMILLTQVQVGKSPLEESQHPMRVRLGGRIALLGYDLAKGEVKAGGKLHLTLYWEAKGRMDTSYTVFVHLLDGEGRIVGQRDGIPMDGKHPTTRWLEGQMIADEYEIAVNPGTPPGEYSIEVGMYELKTGERLAVFDEDGERLEGDRILLSKVVEVGEW